MIPITWIHHRDAPTIVSGLTVWSVNYKNAAQALLLRGIPSTPFIHARLLNDRGAVHLLTEFGI